MIEPGGCADRRFRNFGQMDPQLQWGDGRGDPRPRGPHGRP